MFRSLHMKLVLIMVLLIVSLMTVVGAFLMNSVVGFYMNEFYSQMRTAFSEDNIDFVRDLSTPTDQEEDGAEMISQVLGAYMGTLGVDSRSRNYYVLDGVTGKYLAGSDDEGGENLHITPNITAALMGEMGDESDVTADYMDVAIPIQRGESRYIVYILDNRQTVLSLNEELFALILQALVLGLLISVLLSFLLSKTMITPIERLTAAAQRVAHGDFSRKIQVSSKDEIGVLTENFNSMAHQLESTIADVENERNKLNTLFLYMTDGVVAFSSDGTVIHANPAAREMLARDIGPHTGYDDLFAAIAPMADVQEAGGSSLQGELETGGRILELQLAPFDQDSHTGGVLVVIHDVTTQRRNEEMRREFVANVSHELRTPLTNIRSYAETLSDGGSDLPPHTARSFLNVILNESDRMTHIVQDLLTLSRFDSGYSQLNLTWFSFAQAVEDSYQAVLMEAQRHGHTLSLDLQADLPPIRADRERVLQVMMNILSNAIKYTPDGGTIRISAGRQGQRVWMEVDDNGIGIPAADRPRIFERFYRVDKARSRESGGTGLGLSIAKEIVDRHEGVLRLVDKKDPGLTVRLELLIQGPRERGQSHGA